MKKNRVKFLFISIIAAAGVCFAQEHSLTLKIKNPSPAARTDAYIKLDAEKLIRSHPGLNADNFIIKEGDKVIPHQVEKEGKTVKSFSFVSDYKGGELKKVSLVYGNDIKPDVYKSRTYAELAVKKNGWFDGKRVHGVKYKNVKKVKVPKEHIDHDGLYKYEGPGWESEKVGYRFYLDWRNATDIFGKKVNRLVLAKVGTKDTIADNNESFHTMQEWGMDIFKVGNSLGVGSFGMWSGGKVNMVSKTDSLKCEIAMNGPVKSEIITKYYGWDINGIKYDINSHLEITAGSRLTKNALKIKKGKPDNIVTGLAKYKGTTFIKGNINKGWSYIALYGHQSLADDNLGIVIFYKVKDLIELTEDDLSYVVKLKAEKGEVKYYFGAAWEKEFEGIKSEKEFRAYLLSVVDELNNPLVLE